MKLSIKLKTQPWKAILITSATQAGKTWKLLNLISEKMSEFDPSDVNLLLFVTQANCTMSADQTIMRARQHELFTRYISPENIQRASTCDPSLFSNPPTSSYMFVDFWNTRCMNQMIEYTQKSSSSWKRVIIIIDEVEQGNMQGVKSRLEFINDIQNVMSTGTEIKAVFITATVANLSKTIYQISEKDQFKGLVDEIVQNKIVELHYSHPHSSYVGPSWFLRNDVWRKIVLPTKSQSGPPIEDIICDEVKRLSYEQKELTLFVTSTKTLDHTCLSERLCSEEYNVIVELNGTNNKNYFVRYVTQENEIRTWNIPYTYVENTIEKGKLKYLRISSHQKVYTGIESKQDLTLPHILQCALFMGTSIETIIKESIEENAFYKLLAISDCIGHLRPHNYPQYPRVALIAGHLAGRGITIQNPYIGFACSSFVFIGTNDNMSRGASNAQRFGRACGMLDEIYKTHKKLPIIIATENIIKDAIANEAAVIEKCSSFQNGKLVSLKDLIPKAYWNKLNRQTKENLKLIQRPQPPDHQRMKHLVNRWWHSDTIIGKIVKYVYEKTHVLESDLKKFIEDCGSVNSESLYVHLTRTTKEYHIVFTRSGKITSLREEAFRYIEDMQKVH